MGIKEKILEDNEKLHNFIILLANANDEPVRGRTKFQKMMFLLSNRFDEIREQCSYDKDDFGPHSKVILKELEYLDQVGVLSDNSSEIVITKLGKEIAKEIIKKEDSDVLRIIKEYKEFLNDLDTKELLAYIYSAFPDMTGKSIEYEKLKPDMEKYIMLLVKKEKITAQRAAELLKKTQNYIIKKMKEEGMVVLR